MLALGVAATQIVCCRAGFDGVTGLDHLLYSTPRSHLGLHLVRAGIGWRRWSCIRRRLRGRVGMGLPKPHLLLWNSRHPWWQVLSLPAKDGRQKLNATAIARLRHERAKPPFLGRLLRVLDGLVPEAQREQISLRPESLVRLRRESIAASIQQGRRLIHAIFDLPRVVTGRSGHCCVSRSTLSIAFPV